MADRRSEGDMPRAKRVKVDLDPTTNPYLAHMYEDNDEGGYKNQYSTRNGNGYGSNEPAPLSDFKRHNTTAERALVAEDGPKNPFNGAGLSKQYFNILKTRRELPVSKQRSAALLRYS
jgi:pre-mRNA-splicing factor ATP-dependent RNA helicase DHX15/PRP43